MPYADTVRDVFGPRRLMSGSDWPVSTLAADCGEVMESTGELPAGLRSAERDEVRAGTAQRVYRLTPVKAPAPSVTSLRTG